MLLCLFQTLFVFKRLLSIFSFVPLLSSFIFVHLPNIFAFVPLQGSFAFARFSSIFAFVPFSGSFILDLWPDPLMDSWLMAWHEML